MAYHHTLEPFDEFNQQLLDNVHPPQWSNPRPASRYHLVVVGGGTAGLVAAAGAAGLGAKVALVERDLLGGDCLNVGCVPSKALIRAGRAAAEARRSSQFGVHLDGPPQVDFAAVMRRMRQVRAALSPHDSAHRFQRLGVDVYLGEGRFIEAQTIDVQGARLRFRRAVIATGTRPAIPPIPGLDRVPYLTNENLFSLPELPPRLAVIGAGPIGCEMAQAFAQLGSQVVLVETQHGILPREDRASAQLVQQALERDGVLLRCCSRQLKLEAGPPPRLSLDSHGHSYVIDFDQLLLATGRVPNVEGLELARVGVEHDQQGIRVTDQLQTSNRRIYAAGDVCSAFRFTHAADFMARLVIQNALFLGRKKLSQLSIPWCTYTTPELASVGLNQQLAQQQGIAIETYTQPLQSLDRAVLDGETEGVVHVHVRRGSDRILGGTIVAHRAGDLIGELNVALTHRLGLAQLGATLHPYPTQADALRRLGDQYNRRRLTPLVQRLLATWLKWSR